jgi:FtsH-binding integral membrane protein
MSLENTEHDEERSLVSYQSVDLVISVLLLLASIFLAWSNWKLGAGWAPDGPEAGYFPFYLCVLVGLASTYGIISALLKPRTDSFVSVDQFKRVLQVGLPSAAYVAGIQWLGIYVSSFVLVAGFMHILGKASWLKSLITAAIFVGFIFYVFELKFTVLLPKGPLEALILYR